MATYRKAIKIVDGVPTIIDGKLIAERISFESMVLGLKELDKMQVVLPAITIDPETGGVLQPAVPIPTQIVPVANASTFVSSEGVTLEQIANALGEFFDLAYAGEFEKVEKEAKQEIENNDPINVPGLV